jgi:hypothetical protein
MALAYRPYVARAARRPRRLPGCETARLLDFVPPRSQPLPQAILVFSAARSGGAVRLACFDAFGKASQFRLWGPHDAILYAPLRPPPISRRALQFCVSLRILFAPSTGIRRNALFVSFIVCAWHLKYFSSLLPVYTK